MEKTVECGKADAVDLLFLFSLLGCLIFATPWSVVHQAPLSMGFSRQEYLSGLPFLSPGDLPNQGLKCIFCISCIGRWTLHHWVPREALLSPWVSEVKSLSHVWPFATPWTVAYQVPLNIPGKNTGVDCHFLPLTQGLSPGLPLCRQMLYCLSHQEGH